MERVLFHWCMLLALGLGVGVGWSQTIGSISDQFYVSGLNNSPIPLTLTGFQTNRVIRTAAANITSGASQAYEGPGTRILQGLKPDVVMLQEFNVSSNTSAQIRSWIDSTFGTEFQYYRENYSGIPNGVISRWPILQSGSWDDGPDGVSDRGFAWAQIDIPGSPNLWVVSVHLKASSGDVNASRRNSQAQTLVSLIKASVPAGDYLLIGGDCNTYSYTEACLATLGSVVDVSAPRPVDQANDPDTNYGRSSPYDWVMAEPELDALEVPVTIGTLSFPDGLVFDSRVFSPLSLVSPVVSTDSAASGMQHMAVVRSFQVPTPELLSVQVSSSNLQLLPVANIQVLGSGLGRSLQITPVASQTGSSTVTLKVSDGVSTATKSFLVTVSSVPASYAAWSGDATLNADNLAKYAIGGASSLTATDGVGIVSTVNGNYLVLTAVVRTADSKLTVVGEAVTSLGNYVDTALITTVQGSINGVSQANVPAGHQRQTFAVAQGSDVKKFLRLKVMLAP